MRILLFIFCSLTISLHVLSQESHISVVLDLDGKDFEKSVRSIVPTKDSLYVIANTEDQKGEFYCIDKKGKGYKKIKTYDEDYYQPFSLKIKDSIIYGTTRFSKNKGGSIFKYSLKDYRYEILYDLDYNEFQDVKIHLVNDTAIWLTSALVKEKEYGSIFYAKKDGSAVKKIFTSTDILQGKQPSDLVIYKDTIFISWYGGGKLYPDGQGTFTEAGLIAKCNIDGSNYKTIVSGNDTTGSQPYSVVIKNGRLFGLFSYSGNQGKASFFSSDLEGLDYKFIGSLNNRVVTNMVESDSLIYGFSFNEIFGIDPYTGEYRIFDKLTQNSDFGTDITSNACVYDNQMFFATQQLGLNNGGAILSWKNIKPIIDTTGQTIGRLKRSVIDLNKVFKDSEKDSLSFYVDYNQKDLEVIRNGNTLTFKQLSEGLASLKVTANDGWGGYSTLIYNIGKSKTASNSELTLEKSISFYPNPVISILFFKDLNPSLVQIFSFEGKLMLEKKNVENSINVEDLAKGSYLMKIENNEDIFITKFIKE